MFRNTIEEISRFNDFNHAKLTDDGQPLLQRFINFQFREIDTYNTRLNVNNFEYAQHKEKRDRALNYWKDRVVQDFLPPIDMRKREDIIDAQVRSPNPRLNGVKQLNVRVFSNKKKDDRYIEDQRHTINVPQEYTLLAGTMME